MPFHRLSYLCEYKSKEGKVMIKHLFLIWGLLAALTAEPVLACTSAVVSGKVTPDGRPLLWKNRDTDYLRNHVAYINQVLLINLHSDNLEYYFHVY